MKNLLERDAIGAFCRHTHVEVAGAASGPLAGLTCGIKDLYDIAGHKTGFGSPDWLATHEPAAATAPIGQCLLDAGADHPGKNTTDHPSSTLEGGKPPFGTPGHLNPPGPAVAEPGESPASPAGTAGAEPADRPSGRPPGAFTWTGGP